MSICICGLDHSKPIPDTFEYTPIVYSSNQSTCHACGASGPKNGSFFTDPSLHHAKCKYIKSLNAHASRHSALANTIVIDPDLEEKSMKELLNNIIAILATVLFTLFAFTLMLIVQPFFWLAVIAVTLLVYLT